MTKKEATQILAILKAAYPNSYRGMTDQEALGTVSIWHMQFTTMNPEIVMMAVQKCISSSTFPPSISEVKKKIGNLHWEAYEMLREDSQALPEKVKKAEWVYEQTKDYRCGTPQEPTLCQMIGSTETARLLEN